jgi:hypothetical protein
LTLLKSIRPSNTASFLHLYSFLSEISFSSLSIFATSGSQALVLSPIESKLKKECSDYFMCLLDFDEANTSELVRAHLNPASLDVILSKFVRELCSDQIRRRTQIFALKNDPLESFTTLRKVGRQEVWTLENKLIVNEMDVSTAVSSRNRWSIINVRFDDVKLYSKVLYSYLTDTTGSCIPDALWSNIFLSIFCIITPWQTDIECNDLSDKTSDIMPLSTLVCETFSAICDRVLLE